MSFDGTCSVKLRGRTFSDRELDVIRQSVSGNYGKGRTYISRDICKRLGWKQPNGWLKDRACRDVLLQLESEGVINLPPSLVKKKNRINRTNIKSCLEEYDLVTPVTKFPKSIELKFAKGNLNETIWNELVDRFHYLGHRITVGRCIKYLIVAEGKLLGAISFSSPAWKLKPRDDMFELIGINNPRDYSINNSRFLILPTVQISNFASHVLAKAVKRIVDDWEAYYSITPMVVETFVQPSRFNGTCYKAANWVEVGITKGYAKRGRAYRNSQEPKKIFLYGLDKRVRAELLQSKAGTL